MTERRAASTVDQDDLRNRFQAARMLVGQSARWDAQDPGADPYTCRYCGRSWRKWVGSKLDGHAACYVTLEFKQHVVELLREPSVTYQQIGEILDVSPAVIRSWTFPIAEKQRAAIRREGK